MTTDNSRYEEAAKEYSEGNGLSMNIKSNAYNSFLAGASFAEKQLKEENQRLKEALITLYKEIRSRFAKDDAIAFETMSKDLAKPMLEARKLIEP